MADIHGIKIVNKKVYDGPGEYIGRPSPLGNPFPVSIGRDACIEKYREWLFGQERTSDAWREIYRLARLYKSQGCLVLICWCAPLACHAEVVAEAVLQVIESGEEEPGRETPSYLQP
jgi:hypothetical protein